MPGAGEVLIKVHAAGVDQGVWHLMTGKPYLLRLFGYGLKKPKVPVRGREVAGVVDAVGAGVTRFKPGDEVFGTCEGSFAEYVCAKESLLARRPSNLTFEETAAAPISAVTALQAVRDAGQVGRRPKGAGHRRGRGSGIVRRADRQGLRRGGHRSLQHRQDGPGPVPRCRSCHRLHPGRYLPVAGVLYDVIIDTAGNRPLSVLRKALAPQGTLVIVGGEGGGNVTGGFERSMAAPLASLFSGQKFKGLVSKENHQDLEALTRLLEAGSVKPAVDKVFPLAEAPAAIAYLHAGAVRGKVVVRV